MDESSFEVFQLLAQLIAFQLEAEDEKQAREAEIGALNELISIASHDLRQPLTTLRLRSQFLTRSIKRDSSYSQAQLIERLEEISSDTRRLSLLTDSLLDVGRLRAGSFRLEKTSLDFSALVQQVVEDVKISAPNYQFVIELIPTLPIIADEVKLTQVLRNLLDNAVKYSPNSEKAIEIRLTVSSEREAVLQVRDGGIGVKESDLPKLFQRQFRTQEAIDSGIGGSGLGLYISRQIIIAHDGRLWAENTPNGGLVVSLSLPLPDKN